MSDVMKEAWDAGSKLREIGEIIKRSDTRVQADGTLLKIRMYGKKCGGWRKADEKGQRRGREREEHRTVES